VLVAMLVRAIFPWLANSVWSTSSLDQCREALHGTLGACFSVITERWRQLMYGFYPQELYWRANLTLLLLVVALFRVLFSEVSARTRAIFALVLFALSAWMVWITYAADIGMLKAALMAALFAVIAAAIYRFDVARNWMLVFSVIYPFLLIWLVWGGSVWGPAGVLVGLGLTSLVASRLSGALGTLLSILVGVVFFLFWFFDPLALVLNLAGSLGSLFTADPVVIDPAIRGFALRDIFPLQGLFSGVLGWALPIEIQAVESRSLGGFMVSIIIGISGIALSLPIGIVLALGRQSNLFIVHTLCVGFIEFIRGVPLITLLFTASLLLNYFLPPGTNFDIILRVIIMVTLFASAYMAETIRGGLAALPKGQYEAADSLGLDYWKAQRLIIMPQALKISIPGIVNNFIGLFKDTTLVTFIVILDILNLTNSIRANAEWHGIYWELYIFVGLMFFISCFPMGRYSKWLEQKLQTDHR
jgi:general L-amino acid transport system permease protein